MEMTLTKYLKDLTPEQKRAYAKKCRTTVGYLKQLSGGHSTPGPALAKRLSENSDGAVPLHKIRSDIWPRTSESRVA